jgi:hypothetical protein
VFWLVSLYVAGVGVLVLSLRGVCLCVCVCVCGGGEWGGWVAVYYLMLRVEGTCCLAWLIGGVC